MECMTLELAYIGHPILRKKTFPIRTIDPSIMDLIAHMKERLTASRGLGLAAPQVGVQLSLLVTCPPDEFLEPGPPRAFINPKLETRAVRWQ